MTDLTVLPIDSVERRRIVVRGVVQGVGFRPFVARAARDLGLSGHCGNDEGCVFIEAEGRASALDELVRVLRTSAPPLAHVTDVRPERIDPRGDTGFQIVASRSRPGARTLVPPDVGTCDDCLAEMRDPADRRFRHPFISCTNCGPRFTIIEDLPYDRPATTMAAFGLCPPCGEEYADPTDRRHHAQPIACHDCGPRIWLEVDGHTVQGDDAVLARAQRLLADGGILAVKGVGGFHLACDAANPAAVAELRRRKRRPGKPLAVMARDLVVVRRLAQVSAAEERALTQPARPIVLLRAVAPSVLAPEVAPGLDDIGVLLPYTPLHHLLLDALVAPAVLVMTSGNLADEPLCHRDADARVRLETIADAFLMHDREIAVPCDDSVVAVWEDAELPVRRSRGYAPLPVALDDTGPVTLAVGAEVKNTFCLVRDDLAFCSGHLGDMGSLESQQAFESSVAQLTALRAADPELVVSDDHPGYATRHWAERFALAHDVPLMTVQHHHAHVASLLAEHGLLGTTILGVAFDGTGYGCDHSVWGGELLLVGPDVARVDRVGHLAPFLLAGGDRAVRDPFRVALSLLQGAGVTDVDGLGLEAAGTAGERAVVRTQLTTGTGCVPTTSVGRLFDGVASLLGVRHRVSYEAQAAVELEALARSARDCADLPMDVCDGRLQWSALVRALVAGLRSGVPRADLARGFHRALASATAELAGLSAHRLGVDTVGLTGGVFQNRLLLDDLVPMLRQAGLTTLTHHRVPPNDGGLALGQAAVARARVRAAASDRRHATGDRP